MTHNLGKHFFEALGISLVSILSAGAMETSQISTEASKIRLEQTEIMCNSEPGSESESSSIETQDSRLKEIEILCDSEAWNFAFEYYYNGVNSVQFINGEKTVYSQDQTLSTIKLSSPLSLDPTPSYYYPGGGNSERQEIHPYEWFFIRHMLNDIPTMKSDTYDRGNFYFDKVIPNIVNGKLTVSFDPRLEKLNKIPYTFIKQI